MAKCSWYVKGFWSDPLGYCKGTKEMESCSCQGDESKCDYYPEKRKKFEKMTTLVMMTIAKTTGKTYKTEDMFYNTKLGFHDKRKDPWQGLAFKNLNDLFLLCNWQEFDKEIMTKKEAEKKFNIIIV